MAKYKITEKAWDCFVDNVKFTSTNTKVVIKENRREFWLYDTIIAIYEPGKLLIKTGGWNTATTKERLKGCPIVSINIKTKQGTMYLNGKPWNGEPHTFLEVWL